MIGDELGERERKRLDLLPVGRIDFSRVDDGESLSWAGEDAIARTMPGKLPLSVIFCKYIV